jgi:hypothetical protein
MPNLPAGWENNACLHRADIFWPNQEFTNFLHEGRQLGVGGVALGGPYMRTVFEDDRMALSVNWGIQRVRALLTSRLIQILGAALIVIGTFFTTLWFTEPAPINAAREPDRESSRTEIDKLAEMHVSTWEELRNSAADAGLVPARSMVGVVDELARANDRDVTATGWLADPRGDGAPLTVIAFVGSKSVAIGKTVSERSDVTAALRLPEGVEKNVAFSLTFSCQTGHLPIIVGVGPGRQYRLLELKKVC